MIRLLLVAAMAVLLQAQTPAPAELQSLAEQAYLFAYPLVLMEFTHRGMSSTNQFIHNPAFPTDKMRVVIRPNADTLYSIAWLEVGKEPLLLHVPDTNGRYYVMQLLDAWTETFDSPGKRTTGTGERWFAITGPGWTGTLPERATRIDAPTNLVWLLGRTQTNNVSDYSNVHTIQKGFSLMPLSRYPDGPPQAIAVPRAPGSPAPPVRVEKLSSTEFFNTFLELLQANPPHPADGPMMAKLAGIGLKSGQPFDPAPLGAAFEQGVVDARARLEAAARNSSKPGPTGWTGLGGAKIGRYGNDYLTRAVTARVGLGALPPEDAVYLSCVQDRDGKALEGANQYRLHFPKSAVPPVNAFWSVTMYGADGYFIANPINRFAIGDRDPLTRNPDGSLDLFIQKDDPGGAKTANWLPAPAGPFNLTLRLYWPKESVLQGRWLPPAVLRETN